VNAFRQPGSAFKPLVYAEALHDSIAPNDIIPDTALAILMDNGTVYRPQDDDGQFLGPMTMRHALVTSRNSVAVQLGMDVGIDSVTALARRLGIDTPIAPYPSSAIGASSVRPIDLVAAYTAFDNLGSVVEPRFIKHIEDRTGRVVWTPPAAAPRFAMDPRVAFIVRDMMRDVVGVWVGFDQPTQVARGAAGGSLAAPIWGDMIAKYYASGRAVGTWTDVPTGVVTAELDRDSGQVATDSTPPDRRYTEYFLDGTQPGALRNPWSLWQWGPVGVR